MRNLLPAVSTAVLIIACLPAIAQRPTRPERGAEENVSVTIKDSMAREKIDTAVGRPSVTHHRMTVEGKLIEYTATTGYMLMRNAEEKPIAKIFYVAYAVDDAGGKAKLPPLYSTAARGQLPSGCTWDPSVPSG